MWQRGETDWHCGSGNGCTAISPNPIPAWLWRTQRTDAAGDAAGRGTDGRCTDIHWHPLASLNVIPVSCAERKYKQQFHVSSRSIHWRWISCLIYEVLCPHCLDNSFLYRGSKRDNLKVLCFSHNPVSTSSGCDCAGPDRCHQFSPHSVHSSPTSNHVYAQTRFVWLFDGLLNSFVN